VKILTIGAAVAILVTSTVGFALGQCVGPILVGAVSDQAHNLAAGLPASASLLVLSGAVALTQGGHETGQIFTGLTLRSLGVPRLGLPCST
jgi:hypothetical protein